MAVLHLKLIIKKIKKEHSIVSLYGITEYLTNKIFYQDTSEQQKCPTHEMQRMPMVSGQTNGEEGRVMDKCHLKLSYFCSWAFC